MTARRVIRHLVLDNEAAQALLSRHLQDRRRAAVVKAVTAANGQVVVPTPVRVEAGWRRRDPAAAGANRLAVDDVTFDGSGADRGIELRRLVPSASVVNSAVAVTAERIGEAAGTVEILTSDVTDMTALAGHVRARVVVHRIR